MSRTATRAIRERFALHLKSYWWGRVYRGTKQTLIDGGVAHPNERFPGEPGENKCTKRTTHPDGGRLKIKRVCADRFEVWWRYPDFKDNGVLRDLDPIQEDDPVYNIQEERLRPARIDGRRLRAARNNAAFQKILLSLTKGAGDA